MQKINHYFSLTLYLILLFLSACANKSDQEDSQTNIAVIPTPAQSAKIPEYRVIELFANLTADLTDMEGVWESKCKSFTGSSSYQIRRAYHLNGVFEEVAEFNDTNCTVRNSRNTARLFGTIDAAETIDIFNGTENIEVTKIATSLMIAPTKGRPIALENLTLNDLASNGTTVEYLDLVANRMYFTDTENPGLTDLFMDNQSYLINSNIDTNNKTEEEIDQQVIARYGISPL